MTVEEHEVLARAEILGEALQQVNDTTDPGEFIRLLGECNAMIRQITRIDYGRVCAPAGGCDCGGKC
ncbi:hypothetical protein [Methanoplanus limicola]|uniref:Uncharacterized protein n=1 Tax=Methanoplanus limicola DSM 2279 TaxID=937775 RepID=H1Z1I6_9EURY|nr:hypothetical protein [Methanoplanus limicola]EHQ36333.1 hypothetical protein Metlim_2275 [Methanoplanus limicola DSM 2279]